MIKIFLLFLQLQRLYRYFLYTNYNKSDLIQIDKLYFALSNLFITIFLVMFYIKLTIR
jgi:hypothetical protein